jgi:signal transduction histidine kinase
MDIKLVLRQSTVFLGALLGTVVPIFVIKYYLQKFAPGIAYWSEIVILVGAAALFPVLKERFGRFANKHLFTSLYDSKEIIGHLTDKLSSTLDVNYIYDSVTESLSGAFHAKSISFWDYGESNNNYVLVHEQGLGKWGIRLKGNKNIYQKFFSKGLAVSVEELKNVSGKYTAFVKDFSDLGIEIIVPLKLKDKLIGTMAFGTKESGDIYNSEDFELLKTVSGQMAISLENALLYEETKEFNVKLTKEVESATKDLRQANEELKNLDRAKSEFISIASHQLRTPLTVIKGYGSMMLEGSFGKMEPMIEENMKKIYESNERLITLVEDLLNISRIESGKLQFNYEVCQLEEIVASVVEEMTSTAKTKGLELKYLAPQKLSAVKIDKSKIRQVIINVIDNAIKYTPKGSVTVSLTENKGLIQFKSEDTGMGIQPTDLVNLFQKFSRGEHVSVLHTEGTGLGLYVGKMMIEAHQGKIWAESEGLDKGAQFYFTLPVSRNA